MKKRIISKFISVSLSVVTSGSVLQAIPCNVHAATGSSQAQQNIFFGDLNGDSKVNVLDMTALKRAILKGNYDTKGDCDADGDLDYDDVVWLQDFLLTEVKSYPAYDTIDTDLDGLSDYAEVEYSNTSPTKADTDGDGINDYYEYAFLETDPNTADTNITNADPDKDGLTNLEEQKYGTNPQNADSDNDGFNDSDEIKKHGTDPTKEDTDGDGLTDWDELVDMSEFSLDPNKASTNGTPDGKRVFTQHISADDEMLSAINTDDNAYSLSLDINASGNAKKCISVVESGYTNYMKNGAAIGAVPEITYDDDYTLKDITLKYEIKEDFRESVIDLFTDNYTYDESLAGIKRLNVFKFFEEIDEEMPIDTSYDEDNNIVYVTLTNDSFESSDVVDGINVGSFSLVDLEVWGALMNEHLEEASDENAKIPSSSLPPSNQNAQMSRGYTASVAADDSFIGPPKPDRSNWEQNSKIFKNYISSRVRSQETDISTPVCYGGHYYAVVLANVGWSDAEVRCEALGGHLMTPATAGEFALMQGCLAPGNTTNHYWIGAHLVGGSWQWVNDEGAVTYIDTVPKKYVSGRYYGLSDYGRYISTELYYADGMSYYPFTTNPQIGYIIEWDSLSDYINGTSADISYSIATLIKSMRGNVCLKSPLTKGSAVDSDGDGVPDYDELNLKLLKKVYGTTTPTKTTVSMSTIIRMLTTNTTSKKIVSSSIADKVAAAAKATSSSTVTGTTSIINTEYACWGGDPMASDMDCDYLPDGEDSHKKRFDATPIDAALIDDSSMFTNRDNNKFYSIKAYSDKSTPTTTANEILVNANQKGGGSPSIMEMPENLKKIAITYNRNSNYNQDGRIEFSITPAQENDYEFAITFDSASEAQAALNNDAFMTFTAKKDTNRTVIKYIDQEKDAKTLLCHFNLYAKKEYTVKINALSNNCNLQCIFYQDNWVYAPNGGMRKSNYQVGAFSPKCVDEIFISQDMTILFFETTMQKHNSEDWKNVRTEMTDMNKTVEEVKWYIQDHAMVMSSLNEKMRISVSEASDVRDKYSDISFGAQWVLQIFATGLEAGAKIATISSGVGTALAYADLAVFVGDKISALSQEQLIDAIAKGRGQYCIYNTSEAIGVVGGSYVDISAFHPRSCGMWSDRNGVNGNYICRYYSGDEMSHIRCSVVANDYF